MKCPVIPDDIDNFNSSAINPMLYSVMSTKFRRAFSRILSCRSNRWQDSRTETTFANPSVFNLIQNKGGSSKMEMLENKRRKPLQSKAYSDKNGSVSVCVGQKEHVLQGPRSSVDVSPQDLDQTNREASQASDNDRPC